MKLLNNGQGDENLQTPIQVKGGQTIGFNSLKNLA